MYPILSKSTGSSEWVPTVCKPHERLGWVLKDLESRGLARPVRAGGNAWGKDEMEKIERACFDDMQLAAVRFECSMLQTQVKDGSGQIAWRSVVCEEDDDDFGAVVEQGVAIGGCVA